MEKHRLGLRIYDIYGGLKDLSSGIIEANMRLTKRTGMALRLGLQIRGPQNYLIEDRERLVILAGELGIGYDSLMPTLHTLQELEYCRVHGTIDSGPFKVEVSVPEYRDCYERAGAFWAEGKPTELEQANLFVVDELMGMPARLAELRSKHGIDQRVEQLLLDIGRTAGYLDTLPGKEPEATLIYSPLYWDENEDSFKACVARAADPKVRQLVEKVRSYQGLPASQARSLIKDATVLSGILPMPSVTSVGGTQTFIFTPVSGPKGIDKHVLDNARAILACVRYGQHFAGLTKIKWPELILERLLDKSRAHRMGSHQEIPDQYALLVRRGVATIERDTVRPGRYYLRLIPTDENVAAISLARDLLLSGEAIETRTEEEASNLALFQPGQYHSPISTIIRHRRELRVDPKGQRRLIQDINDLMQGAILP